jgi:hypothetical protein
MAMSQERKIIGPFLKKGHILFNDKMSTGGRSIKVWGWKKEDYDAAQAALEAAGYTVKRIVTPVYNKSRIYQIGGNTRLQIT